MSYIERHSFTLTTDASGNATVYSTIHARGEVFQIAYVPDATNPLATGADLVITGESSGLPIATLTNIGTVAVQWAPRMPTTGTTGAAALYAAAGTAVNDRIAMAGERIKVAVAQGGNTLTGTLYIWVG